MEGKWFADTFDGVRLHAASLYPDGDFHIIAAEIPEKMLDALYRPDNLDRFGPATYLESDQLVIIVPITEVGRT